MTLLWLWSFLFHEHDGSSSGALGFHEYSCGSRALFFHTMAPVLASVSFYKIFSIVLICLKLMGN